jgi:hypothetical protein
MRKGGVIRVEADCGRSFFKVEGKRGKEYHVLSEVVSCPCSAFLKALTTHSSLMVRPPQCKHMLAAVLSEELQSITTIVVPDALFSFYLLQDV